MVLDDSQISAYFTNGYLVVPNLISDREITALNSDSLDLVQNKFLLHKDNLRCRFKLRCSGEAVLDALDPITDILESAHAIAHSSQIAETLQALWGEAPLLFKDKLIFKPADSPGYALHQDFISWPFFPESFTTVLIALDPSDEGNGGLEVYKQSHTQGYLSPRDGDFHDLAASRFDEEQRIPLRLNPGDAVIFGCYLVHGSGINNSRSFRRHLYLSYNRRSDGGDQRSAHYRSFHLWLRRRYSEYGAKECYFK